MRTRNKLLLGLAAVVLILAGLAGWDMYRFVSTPANLALGQEARYYYLLVEKGASFDRVAEDLFAQGGLSSVGRFKLLGRLEGQASKIKAGEFEFSTAWTPVQVLDQLVSGRALLHRITIPEGLPWWEVGRLLEERGFATAEDFAACVKDAELLRRYGIPFDSAEGFLFPETYLLNKGRTPTKAYAQSAMQTMVRTFWNKTAPIWAEAAFAAQLTPAAPNTPDPTDTAGAPAGPDAAVAPNTPAMANAPGTLIKPGVSDITGTQDVSGAPVALGASDIADTSAAPAGPIAPDTAAASDTAAAPATAGGDTLAPVTPAGGPLMPVTPDGPVASYGQVVASFVPAFARENPDAVKRLVILASLVEKESAVADERPRIAGVYSNRLRINMPLQCDPTIIYGLGDRYQGKILRSHLTDASNPYNTYKFYGLPPGPICSPGLGAIQAAAEPEVNKFLYFVATGKADGRHIFSKTLSEHNAAVQRYRAVVRAGRAQRR